MSEWSKITLIRYSEANNVHETRWGEEIVNCKNILSFERSENMRWERVKVFLNFYPVISESQEKGCDANARKGKKRKSREGQDIYGVVFVCEKHFPEWQSEMRLSSLELVRYSFVSFFSSLQSVELFSRIMRNLIFSIFHQIWNSSFTESSLQLNSVGKSFSFSWFNIFRVREGRTSRCFLIFSILSDFILSEVSWHFIVRLQWMKRHLFSFEVHPFINLTS